MGEIFAQSYLKYGFLGCVVRMGIEIIADRVLMLDEKGSWRAAYFVLLLKSLSYPLLINLLIIISLGLNNCSRLEVQCSWFIFTKWTR